MFCIRNFCSKHDTDATLNAKEKGDNIEKLLDVVLSSQLQRRRRKVWRKHKTSQQNSFNDEISSSCISRIDCSEKKLLRRTRYAIEETCLLCQAKSVFLGSVYWKSTVSETGGKKRNDCITGRIVNVLLLALKEAFLYFCYTSFRRRRLIRRVLRRVLRQEKRIAMWGGIGKRYLFSCRFRHLDSDSSHVARSRSCLQRRRWQQRHDKLKGKAWEGGWNMLHSQIGRRSLPLVTFVTYFVIETLDSSTNESSVDTVFTWDTKRQRKVCHRRQRNCRSGQVILALSS